MTPRYFHIVCFHINEAN